VGDREREKREENVNCSCPLIHISFILREIERQTDRETDRQTDRQRQRGIEDRNREERVVFLIHLPSFSSLLPTPPHLSLSVSLHLSIQCPGPV
jgi:hypothetical protein